MFKKTLYAIGTGVLIIFLLLVLSVVPVMAQSTGKNKFAGIMMSP